MTERETKRKLRTFTQSNLTDYYYEGYNGGKSMISFTPKPKVTLVQTNGGGGGDPHLLIL